MNHFDYFHKEYGDPILHISRYKCFLHIEATCVLGAYELELWFYYRLDKSNVLEIITHDRDKNEGYDYHIAGRFQLYEPFYTGLLKRYIREYIQGVKPYYGLDYDFYESTVISERNFLNLLDDIEADQRIVKYRAEMKWAGSEMARLCNQYNLHIFYSGEEDHLAECMCPTGRGHRVTINMETGSWFCGYCKENGGVKEMKHYSSQSKYSYD